MLEYQKNIMYRFIPNVDPKSTHLLPLPLSLSKGNSCGTPNLATSSIKHFDSYIKCSYDVLAKR